MPYPAEIQAISHLCLGLSLLAFTAVIEIPKAFISKGLGFALVSP